MREFDSSDSEVELFLIQGLRAHYRLFESMWDHIKQWAEKEEKCVAHVAFLVLLGVSDVDHVDNHCRQDDEASNDVSRVVFKADAAWAEKHV